MHQRALPRLANASSSIRHISKRTISTRPFPARREPRNEESRKPNPVAKTLQDVLSPEACALLRDRRAAIVPRRKGKQAVPANTSPPSMEKLMFKALDSEANAETDVLLDTADPDAFGETSQRIPAGTFVEVRRNDIRAIGVVLFTLLVERKWTVYTLTHRGEIWPHHEHDVQFMIPNFISRTLAEQCGLLEAAASEAEINARVDVMKRIRAFEKRFEEVVHSVFQNALDLNFYEAVAHSDPKISTSITVSQAAEKLLGGRPVTPMGLLAVQTYLMDNSQYFVVESRRFLKSHRFWVRSRDDTEVISAVHQMTQNNDPALDAFAEKARGLVLASRQRATESYTEPPSRRPLDGIDLTDKDKLILRFLRASLRVVRHVQTDPYIVPYSTILKKTGLYDVEAYGNETVSMLLTEMGMLAPWQETITREEELREEPPSSSLKPSIPTPLLPEPLGPEDFYSHDLVDSLRHDFGDLPAFVVDDWNAEELDDGISAETVASDPEHVWLHVHIADPTTLLPPTHTIAKQAFRLGTARYFLDRTVPMLPHDIAFHQYSLGHSPGEPNKTLTFSAKVNSAGDIVEYKVRPAVVRNVRTIKYDQLDKLLDMPTLKTIYPFAQGEVAQPTFEVPVLDSASLDNLRLLREVTSRLVRARVRNGAVTLALPQPDMKVSPRPLPNDIIGTGVTDLYAFRGFPELVYGIRHTRETGARHIVSEGMVAACRVASMFFRDRDIPALRRSVGPMQSERVGGLEAVLATRDETGVVDYYTTLRQLFSAPPGRYLTTPGPHSLLGVPEGEGYVKVTSPLRRFGDILAHWQIKHALLADAGHRTRPALFSDDWLVRFGDELEVHQVEAKRQERLQIGYWAHLFLQRWMADPSARERAHDPLRELTGRALSSAALNTRTKEFNFQVYVPELALKGMVVGIPHEGFVETGDEVKVAIKEVRLGARPALDLVLR